MSIAVPPLGRLLEGTPRAGGLEELDAINRFLISARDDGAEVLAAVRLAGEQLGGSESVAVQEALIALGERIVPGILVLTETGGRGAEAVATYIAAIIDIHARADRLELRAEELRADIATCSADIAALCAEIEAPCRYAWNEPPDTRLPRGSVSSSSPAGCEVVHIPTEPLLWARLERERAWRKAASAWAVAVGDLERARVQWRLLITERIASETRLRETLAGTPIGQLAALAAGEGRSLDHLVAASLSDPAPRTSHPLLRELLGTSDGSGVWIAPPDPDSIASRWAALPEWEREALIAAVPWVIGNLPGVRFADRDRANRIMLERYIAHQGEMSPQSKRALAEIVSVVYGDEREPPVSVVALDLGRDVPMVSIGYGDLDEAEYLSWGVPGMLSDAHHAVPPWDTAMRGQYAEQKRELLSRGGSGARPALIAFLSYDTPNLVTVLGVEAARTGSVRLAAELDGSYATRAANTPTSMHGGIGHSYGTTTLVDAVALVKHPLDHVILVASAGLDSGRISSFHGLNVQRDEHGVPRVYTTLASSDDLAPFGAAVSLRLQPNPGRVALLGPSIGGGYFFSSDGFEELKAVEGHDVVNKRGTGYFNRGTQASASIAAIATGDLDGVTGGLRRVRDLDTAPGYLAGAFAVQGGAK